MRNLRVIVKGFVQSVQVVVVYLSNRVVRVQGNAMKTPVEILTRNARQAITGMQRKGTIGCSETNLKQVTPTTGLTCSVPEYHAAWNTVVAELKSNPVGAFELYERNPEKWQ